jgi:D-glycero-D-manno-heptose 1,7-bisphosphate phosphatase
LTVAVFLDRDGVLNEAIVREGLPCPPSSMDELVIVKDAFSSLTSLRSAGFRLIVVTNQPDIARGTTSRQTVEQINGHLLKELPIDDVEICPHDDSERCDCRKPLPGMLLRAGKRHGIDLKQSFMVGDRWRDIEAGRRAGCRTVLIGDGYAEGIRSKPDIAVPTLTEAAQWIITKSNRP